MIFRTSPNTNENMASAWPVVCVVRLDRYDAHVRSMQTATTRVRRELCKGEARRFVRAIQENHRVRSQTVAPTVIPGIGSPGFRGPLPEFRQRHLCTSDRADEGTVRPLFCRTSQTSTAGVPVASLRSSQAASPLRYASDHRARNADRWRYRACRAFIVECRYCTKRRRA